MIFRDIDYCIIVPIASPLILLVKNLTIDIDCWLLYSGILLFIIVDWLFWPYCYYYRWWPSHCVFIVDDSVILQYCYCYPFFHLLPVQFLTYYWYSGADSICWPIVLTPNVLPILPSVLPPLFPANDDLMTPCSIIWRVPLFDTVLRYGIILITHYYCYSVWWPGSNIDSSS